jgi:hypothetical protein
VRVEKNARVQTVGMDCVINLELICGYVVVCYVTTLYVLTCVRIEAFYSKVYYVVVQIHTQLPNPTSPVSVMISPNTHSGITNSDSVNRSRSYNASVSPLALLSFPLSINNKSNHNGAADACGS